MLSSMRADNRIRCRPGFSDAVRSRAYERIVTRGPSENRIWENVEKHASYDARIER